MSSSLDGAWHYHVPKEKRSARNLWPFSSQKMDSHGERRGVVMLLPACAPHPSFWGLYSVTVHVWSA